jgi:hypothetical protein
MAIEHIGKLTPNAVLADALSEVEEIDHVVLYVAKKGDNDSYVSWSRCEFRDTAYGIQMIQREFNRCLEQ